MGNTLRTLLTLLTGNMSIYSIRAVTLVIQFAVLALLTESLKTGALATYFAVVAVSNILIAFPNGFVRYKFRLLHRGVPNWSIMVRVLQMQLVTALPGVVLLIIYCLHNNFHLWYGLIALAALMIGNSTEFNRHVLIMQDKVKTVILLEGAQPLIFIFLMAAQILHSPLTIELAFFFYFISFSLAFLVFSVFSRTGKDWQNAYGAMTNIRRFNGKSLIRSVKRAFPVSFEYILIVVMINLLVALSGVWGSKQQTALLGVFQRLLQIIVAFTSASITKNLKKYYSTHATDNLIPLYTITIMLVGLTYLGTTVFLMLPLDSLHSQTLRYIQTVFFYQWSFSVTGSLLFLILHLSFVALGANLKSLRVIASLSTIALMTIGFRLFISPMDSIHNLMVLYNVALASSVAIYHVGLRSKRRIRKS